MSQNQLEMAWLGAIFHDPQNARKSGLAGLDQSMFRNKEWFRFGLQMLRDANFQGLQTVIEDMAWYQELIRLGIVAKINEADSAQLFLPAFYKAYCLEIESRHDDGLTPSWARKENRT